MQVNIADSYQRYKNKVSVYISGVSCMTRYSQAQDPCARVAEGYEDLPVHITRDNACEMCTSLHSTSAMLNYLLQDDNFCSNKHSPSSLRVGTKSPAACDVHSTLPYNGPQAQYLVHDVVPHAFCRDFGTAL